MKESLEKFIQDHNIESLEIVSGGARGADRMGEEYAHFYNHKLKSMPADWDTFGKAAGYRRNADMADYADGCIVFWDGKSKGSRHMIDLANKKGITTVVVNY